MKFSKIFEPAVVLTPFVQKRSFIPMGIPSKSLISLFLEIFLSDSFAISIAFSNVLVMKQFRFDFSILSIKNSVSSSELNSFFRRHSLAVEISKFLKSVTLLYYLWHNKKARFTLWGIF